MRAGASSIWTGPKGIAWQIRAIPAEGHRKDNNQAGDILGVDLAKGDYVRGWWCVCPDASDIVSAGVAGSLTPGSADEIWYTAWLSQFKDNTENSCLERAADIGTELGTVIKFDGPQDVTCEDALLDEVPFQQGDCLLDCNGELPPINATEGAPEPPGTSGSDGADAESAEVSSDDGGVHVYGVVDWDDVILAVGANSYRFDLHFYYELLDDLSVLGDDYLAVGIGTSRLSHRGFEFEVVGSESIAAALEFQEGDVVWELNGEPFESLEDVTTAFEELHDALDFTVKLDRGTTTVTKTIQIYDLGTYPYP
ncbi:MAG: site-2 protease family protein [Nannocystaceae bacterium]|nr:site-2 protease family protein [Nannocystaceae bacterium]